MRPRGGEALAITADIDTLAQQMRVLAHDPVRFVRKILGTEPDAWQIEALQALEARGRLAIRAGHG